MFWPKESKFLFGIGLLVLIAGVLPLINQYKLLVLPSFIPVSGLIYQIIIIALGLIAILLGKPSKRF